MGDAPGDHADTLRAALQHATTALTARPAAMPEQRDALHALLAEHIEKLLRTDRRTLLQVLYRVDVDEQRARRALGRPLCEAKDALATLVLQRLQRTAAARRRYYERST